MNMSPKAKAAAKERNSQRMFARSLLDKDEDLTAFALKRYSEKDQQVAEEEKRDALPVIESVGTIKNSARLAQPRDDLENADVIPLPGAVVDEQKASARASN